MALTARSAAACQRLVPVGRRRLAAGLLVTFTGAGATACAPRARAELVARAEAGDTPTPPWERPVDEDGLQAVRERIRAYGLRSQEEKLLSVLQELKADEKQYLRWFDRAEKEGDEGQMRRCHAWWKDTTEKIELLLENPRKFVRKEGYLYDIKPPRNPKRSPPFF